MPGCCCCMPLLHNHLMDSCSYVRKIHYSPPKGGAFAPPLPPLNPPLPTFMKQDLLGLFWREKSSNSPFCEITATSHTFLHFGAFNFRKFSVTVKSISCICHTSLVPTPRAPPGEKRSGERSRISWAFSSKRWKTNEIARSLIIT